jgi:hypothetical protein
MAAPDCPPYTNKKIRREIVYPRGIYKTIVYTDNTSEKVLLTDQELEEREKRLGQPRPKKYTKVNREKNPKPRSIFVPVTKEDIKYYDENYGPDTVCPCCLHEFSPEDFKLQPYEPTEACKKNKEAWLKLAEGGLLECPQNQSRTKRSFTLREKLWKFFQLDKLADYLKTLLKS